MKKLIICIAFLGATAAMAQGKLEVESDAASKSAIQAYAAKTESEKVQGFKVQLCSESGNNARQKATSIKSNFLSKYPNYDAQMVWESPNFKVRVGNFTSKLDATLFWRQIVPFFPQAYVVATEIKP